MGLVVQKFGGSSVADTDKLFRLCKHITREYDAKNHVIVVVSAQGKTTDRLIAEEEEITEEPIKREHDVLVSTGEQITASKLAMCLDKIGYDAISYLGWQIPIITNNKHGEARIKSIDDTKILESLNSRKIVIITGFQGIDEDGNITTLGRGGSDTTAIALAAALKADKCEIYTDVDGVFSADPKDVKDSLKIETITYDEMLELASSGAEVLHNRCVEIGSNFNIPIIAKSTFKKDSTGTIVKYQKDIEDLYVSGISKMDNVSRITLIGMNSKIDELYKLFDLLAENNINIDIISQSYSENDIKDVSFSIQTADLKKIINLLRKNLEYLGAKEFLYSENLAKISIVGIGMASTPGITSKLFKILSENKINIHMISTSEIKVAILIDQSKADIAMQSIHDEFIKNKESIN